MSHTTIKTLRRNYFGWFSIACGLGCLLAEPSSKTFQELMPVGAFFNLFIGLLSFPLYRTHLSSRNSGTEE